MLVQIYVDDIIFGSTNNDLCQEFSKTMQSEFEMSHMGELNFFLGLQIKQLRKEYSSTKTSTLKTYSNALEWTTLQVKGLQ